MSPEEIRAKILEETSVCHGDVSLADPGRDYRGKSFRAMTSTGENIVSGTIYSAHNLQERLFGGFSALLRKAAERANDRGMKV